MSETLTSLSAAAEAFEAGRRADGLAHLLTAWRTERQPAIADALDLASTEAARALPAIAGSTRAAFHEAWLDLSNRRRPVDVPRLLATLMVEPWTKLTARLERLSQFPDDPRIAIGLARIVDELPTVQVVNASLLKLLERQKDVRVKSILLHRRSLPDGRLAVEEKLYPAIDRIVGSLGAQPPLPASAQALLTRIEVAVKVLAAGEPATDADFASGVRAPQRDEAALLAAVYENPDDDAPRLVYADYLSEQGDERGELILLQCQPRRGTAARTARLLKDLERDCLGPLEPVIVEQGLLIERGFLAQASVAFHTPAQFDALADHPAWSTLTVLDAWTLPRGAADDFVVRCEARGLREILHPVSRELAAQMSAREKPYRVLESLAVMLEPDEPGTLDGLGDARVFPSLTRLQVLGPVPPEQLIATLAATPLGQQLTELGLLGHARGFVSHGVGEQPETRLHAAIEAAAAMPSLQKLQLRGTPLFTFTRAGQGWELDLQQFGRDDALWLRRVLPGLQPMLTRVVLDEKRSSLEARTMVVHSLSGIEVVTR